MISNSFVSMLVLAGLLLVPGRGAAAQGAPPQPAVKPLPFVSPIFGDNMVLQRGKPDTIWGWSDPGDTVRVQIGENAQPASPAPIAGGR